MPSKAMIEVARNFHEQEGIAREKGSRDDRFLPDQTGAMNQIRALRDQFAGGVLENLIEPLGDKLIKAYAEFFMPSVLNAGEETVNANKIIIATGSRPVIPNQWQPFGDHVLTTDTIFEQQRFPPRMAVVGLGAIGLELGQAMADLGVEVSGFDMLTEIGGLQDPEVNETAVQIFGDKFPLFLGHEVEAEEIDSGLQITSGRHRLTVDKVLLSVSRVPNLEGLHLDRLGIDLDDGELPPINPQSLQLAKLPIFLAGDVNGYRPVLHEAVHEGKVAGFNATHDPPVEFVRKTRLNIAFCDPNVCSIGASQNQLRDMDALSGMARCSGGREKIMGQDEGVIKIYGHQETGKLLGAELVAPCGEHMAHMLAWAIQRELSVFDLLELPFYHPVVEETLEGALKDLAKKLGKAPGLIAGFRTASG
jgi:dihydrolipoamide dehydrogenase